jgi:hypothetical protein
VFEKKVEENILAEVGGSNRRMEQFVRRTIFIISAEFLE